MNRSIALAAAGLLLLSGCETTNPYSAEPRVSHNAPAIVRGAASARAGVPAYSGSGAGRNTVAHGPIGILAGGLVGHYMDSEEADLRRRLRASGVKVLRQGDDIVLVMKSDMAFKTGSPELSARAIRMIGAVAEALRHYDRTLIDVNGYTDTTGSSDYNMKLSQGRAESVADVLVQDGINPARISPRGFGETHLQVPTGDDVSEPANRRVEIRIAPHTATG